jgi:hypothetical protein
MDGESHARFLEGPGAADGEYDIGMPNMCVLSRSSFFRQTLTLVTKTGTREESSSARWCSSWEIRRSSRTIRPACTATSISRRRYVSVSPPLSLSVLTFHYAGLLLRNLQCYRWQDQGPEGRRRRSFRSVVGRPRNPPQGQVEGGPLRRSHLHRRPEIRLSRIAATSERVAKALERRHAGDQGEGSGWSDGGEERD